MSRNNNSKGNKNSEYSINQGLTEKLRSLHKTLFFVISQFVRRKIKDYPIRVMTITFKNKIPSFLRSGIVYKFQCGSCNATYCGKTKRHFKVRMCEHLGISALTGKRVKGDDDSAIKEHLLFCNHTPDFEDFSILATNNNDFKVTLMESLLINRDHPPLNKSKQSLPLELFDS